MSRSARSAFAGFFDLAAAVKGTLAHLAGQGDATDWTLIQEALHASGVEFPGNVLRVELVRQDIQNLMLHGQPVPQSETAVIANGFIAFKEAEAGRFYVMGSLPALEAEVSALLTALRSNKSVQISTIAGKMLGEVPRLSWVNFEAAGDGLALATSLDTALQVVHSPQLHVNAASGSNLAADAANHLPPQLVQLFKEGMPVRLNDTLVFYFPRPDENRIPLHGNVSAAAGLGLGQSIYIQTPSFSGSRHTTLNTHFVLRRREVQPVLDVLRAGGFHIASLISECLDAHTHLVHLHAAASGNGLLLGNAIVSAIHVIEMEANSREPKAQE